MTTIITRLYPSTAAAQTVVNDLLNRGHSEDYIDIISREGAASIADRIRTARVSAQAAAAFAGPIADGKALVVVRAPFNPIGAARHAIRVLKGHPSLDAGVADENEYIREEPRIELEGSVMRNHPLFMSNPFAMRERGTVSSAFGLSTISPRATKTSAIAGGGFMSTKVLPFPLLSRGKVKTSAAGWEWQLSRMFGMPTILRT